RMPRPTSSTVLRPSRLFVTHCPAPPPAPHSFPHDALPISAARVTIPRMPHHETTRPLCTEGASAGRGGLNPSRAILRRIAALYEIGRDTSELQSPCNLVCRLLLEKKNIAEHVRSSISRKRR